MAKESGPNKPPDPIKAEIARSRDLLERDLRGLRYELDFKRKIRQSFRQQTVVWVAAAALLGTVLVVLPRKKKTVYVDAKGKEKPQKRLLEAGFLLGALRIAATLLRPALISFVKQKMTGGSPAAHSASRW